MLSCSPPDAFWKNAASGMSWWGSSIQYAHEFMSQFLDSFHLVKCTGEWLSDVWSPLRSSFGLPSKQCCESPCLNVNFISFERSCFWQLWDAVNTRFQPSKLLALSVFACSCKRIGLIHLPTLTDSIFWSTSPLADIKRDEEMKEYLTKHFDKKDGRISFRRESRESWDTSLHHWKVGHY